MLQKLTLWPIYKPIINNLWLVSRRDKGVSSHDHPRKILDFGCSNIASGAILG